MQVLNPENRSFNSIKQKPNKKLRKTLGDFAKEYIIIINMQHKDGQCH
jgi:hypothetical protein